MRTFLTLMQREWLQHRFGWSLLILVPVALALLLTSVGQIELGDAPVPPAAIAAVTLAGTTLTCFLIIAMTSLILISGLARRDHQDRSIEFWLSLPTGHASSLAAPLLMHLLVAPALALVAGLVGGWLLSFVVVARVAGVGAWFALPWGDVMQAALALLARLLAGLPLAVLWLLPLVLAQVLSNAYLKRWGLPALVALLVLTNLLLEHWLGWGSLTPVLSSMLQGAAQAMVSASGQGVNVASADDAIGGLRALPGWALSDFAAALRAAASPLFLACLAVSAALFAALVDWRRRGASAAG